MDSNTYIQEFVKSKQLSEDKLHVVNIMHTHFLQLKNGTAYIQGYVSPILLVTGAPGTGKSKLIESLTELAELMDLEKPIKAAFMGIAAINIDGFTLNHSLLDVPLEMNENGGSTKHIKPWDTDQLQQFKLMYDMERLSAVIIDEMSMVKPWMLAYAQMGQS
jgi:ATP-dependent exoDNAse (exonuclease V) alpha subunit